jgi:hypothetical protein
MEFGERDQQKEGVLNRYQVSWLLTEVNRPAGPLQLQHVITVGDGA